MLVKNMPKFTTYNQTNKTYVTSYLIEAQFYAIGFNSLFSQILRIMFDHLCQQ
jgi:hypothetical protein